jgi:hypothetical protein
MSGSIFCTELTRRQPKLRIATFAERHMKSNFPRQFLSLAVRFPRPRYTFGDSHGRLRALDVTPIYSRRKKWQTELSLP